MLNYPEDANNILKNLNEELDKKSYKYKGQICEDLGDLEEVYHK